MNRTDTVLASNTSIPSEPRVTIFASTVVAMSNDFTNREFPRNMYLRSISSRRHVKNPFFFHNNVFLSLQVQIKKNVLQLRRIKWLSIQLQSWLPQVMEDVGGGGGGPTEGSAFSCLVTMVTQPTGAYLGRVVWGGCQVLDPGEYPYQVVEAFLQ